MGDMSLSYPWHMLVRASLGAGPLAGKKGVFSGEIRGLTVDRARFRTSPER